MVHEEDQEYVTEVYEELLSGEIKKRMEFRIILADKTERWLWGKPLLIQANGKRALTRLAEDITNFKRYAEVEQKYSHKKNVILQILSHDIAGPLGTFQSLSSLIVTRVALYKDEDLNHVVSLMTQTAIGDLRLIRDFIEQEFIESSNTPLIKARVNIVEKLTEVIEQYKTSG